MLAAYADGGLSEEAALKMGAALAGGSTVGGECGAVAAGYLVLGLKHGRTVPAFGDVEKEKELFDRIRRFVEEFRKRHGAITCRELLGVDVFTREGLAEGRQRGLFRERCPRYVRDAITILEAVSAETTRCAGSSARRRTSPRIAAASSRDARRATAPVESRASSSLERTPMSTMTVTFPGGKRVDAEYGGFVVQTDQPPQGWRRGLGAAAVRPLPGLDRDLRGHLRQGLLRLAGPRDRRAGPRDADRARAREESGRPLAIEIKLPEGFPEKHREAVIRAADLCAVKKHMLNPPAFEIRTV